VLVFDGKNGLRFSGDASLMCNADDPRHVFMANVLEGFSNFVPKVNAKCASKNNIGSQGTPDLAGSGDSACDDTLTVEQGLKREI
jgi:hypothetical protein